MPAPVRVPSHAPPLLSWRVVLAIWAACAFALGSSQAGAKIVPTATASIHGPVTGGARGHPFTAATIDLASYGYVEEEFFLEGTATTWAPALGTTLGSDGHWHVVPAGSAAFRTRMLVRRPASRSHFNGTVLVEWLNVTGGFDIDAVWAQVYTELLRSGYAWVGVSAQRASVNGPPVLEGVSQPLVTWDPGRYATLLIEDDASSYDIFSQAGMLLGPHRPRVSSDPLGGLYVRRMLATGASQSAHRLATYVDGIHPFTRVYDGFLIFGRFGRGAALAQGVDVASPLLMRTDLTEPVLTVNSESEALAHFSARQPDTATLRYWEVAGAAHQSAYVDVTIDAEIRRDLGFSLPPCDPPGNGMPIHYVLNAALDHLDRWASHSAEQARVRRRSVGVPAGESGGPAGGRMIRSSASRVAPPSWPPIVVRGDPPEIERDGFGNALGGIRLPQIEVPIAQYGPVGMPESLRCDLRGFTIPFPDSLLAMLYPDHRTYVQKIRAVTLAAVHAGFVLPIDARDIERMAEAAAIP